MYVCIIDHKGKTNQELFSSQSLHALIHAHAAKMAAAKKT
jgi:hypothetical protein